MCLCVFVGSEHPLPLLPFDAAAPAFFSEPLWAEAAAIGRTINKPFVYAVGSYQGCGCGFGYHPDDLQLADDETIPNDVRKGWRVDYEARVSSVEQFTRYLRGGLTAGVTVRVFTCWYGEWEAAPIATHPVTPEHFGGVSFHFVERELLVVHQA